MKYVPEWGPSFKDQDSEEYGLSALPRWYTRDWVMNIFIEVFGHELGAKQPLKFILYREVKSS